MKTTLQLNQQHYSISFIMKHIFHFEIRSILICRVAVTLTRLAVQVPLILLEFLSYQHQAVNGSSQFLDWVPDVFLPLAIRRRIGNSSYPRGFRPRGRHKTKSRAYGPRFCFVGSFFFPHAADAPASASGGRAPTPQRPDAPMPRYLDGPTARRPTPDAPTAEK